MKIKFKSTDPRAGMVAEFDSSRGRELIEAGAATEVKGDGESASDEPAPKAVTKAAKKKAG